MTAHSLFVWLKARLPRAYATLRPPAAPDEIEQTERELGRTLPSSLAALYAEHDGQSQGRLQTAIFESYRWMPLAECLAMRKLNTEVLEGVRREYPEVEPWPPEWLPFAEDGLGNCWAIDLAKGDVFDWAHDEGRGDTLGASFDDFLQDYVDSIERGERVIDDELGVIRPIAPAPEQRVAISPARRAIGVVALLLWAVAFVFFVIWLESRR